MTSIDRVRTAPNAFRLGFASGAWEVRAVLRELKRSLCGVGLSQEETDTVEIVLGEVLNNVVEHAYGYDTGGEIALRCRIGRKGLQFGICDSGRAMPGLSPPEPGVPDMGRELSDLPEGGFGWYLVTTLTTGLRYVRRCGCNILVFRIPTGPLSPLPSERG